MADLVTARICDASLPELRREDYEQRCAMAAFFVHVRGVEFVGLHSLYIWLWAGGDDNFWQSVSVTARRFVWMRLIWCTGHQQCVLSCSRYNRNPSCYGTLCDIIRENWRCAPCYRRRQWQLYARRCDICGRFQVPWSGHDMVCNRFNPRYTATMGISDEAVQRTAEGYV